MQHCENPTLAKSKLRNLLKKQPLMLQKDGQVAMIGGPDQCSRGLLRRVLARFHNWVLLVQAVLKAELPEFETFSSMHTLLQLEHDVTDSKAAAKRMAVLLNISAATELLFGGS